MSAMLVCIPVLLSLNEPHFVLTWHHGMRCPRVHVKIAMVSSCVPLLLQDGEWSSLYGKTKQAVGWCVACDDDHDVKSLESVIDRYQDAAMVRLCSTIDFEDKYTHVQLCDTDSQASNHLIAKGLSLPVNESYVQYRVS
ncbi:hypothetical protein F4780DRAFT_418743 [Xylariomycetidae sp. FL0641]|nr:hypothetical protein F4780DRAFT_418743 [Xylariomycetidae sp. FL0641]